VDEFVRRYDLPNEAIAVAEQLAEATVDLHRIRDWIASCIDLELECIARGSAGSRLEAARKPEMHLAPALCAIAPDLRRLRRFESRALGRRRSAIRALASVLTGTIRDGDAVT
jgi:hypothetical protein